MNYLFIASLGPVQDFIASARRTGDLYSGSWLMSEVSKSAAREIVEIEGGSECLIFPAPSRVDDLVADSDLRVANKIIARITYPPAEVGPRVRQAIQKRLNDIKDEAFKDIGQTLNVQQANAQVEHFIEYMWVAMPLPENDYAGARRHLEDVLDARKRTRNFMPVTWGDQQPKSSITGQLESVIPLSCYPDRRDTSEEKIAKVKQLFRMYGAGPAEHLSAIDLIKRRSSFRQEQGFASTSHIAATPYLERLNALTEDQLKTASNKLCEYREMAERVAGMTDTELFDKFSPRLTRLPQHPLLKKNDEASYDGANFFEERLLDRVTNKREFRKISATLERFFQYIDSCLGLGRPAPYYAILVADGDGMGKVIDAQKDFQQHQELSQALDGFARRVVPQIIREYQGSLVYSGGDDIMALVPLHTVLQCAQELRKNYEQVMSDYRDSQGRSSTLSAGIAIMHHLELLQEAVKLARVAEEQAKSLEDKNALAITISKRGGEPVHFAAKWERVDILERLITWYRDDLLPHGTAYELRDLVQRLTVLAQENDKAEIQAVIKRDAWRILRRKLNDWQSARTKEAQKQVQERANMLKNWLDIPLDDRANQTTSQENSLEQQSSPFSVDELIHALIVAEILADAQRLATPVKKEIKQ